MPFPFPTRKIGQHAVSAIGYGAMGTSANYTTSKLLPDEDRYEILDALNENGCTNWDTADVYGDSEELIGRWFARTGKRDDIFIATRFGLVPDRDANGEPEYVEQALNRSLERLEVDAVDLYYLHRPDPQVPIEVRAEHRFRAA
ncbi:hypothetical protein AcW1_001856 [Taiwanofungus camphoratus]|nr:hypothetical protein AcW1_001856 [Antrodia cinnamomea]